MLQEDTLEERFVDMDDYLGPPPQALGEGMLVGFNTPEATSCEHSK